MENLIKGWFTSLIGMAMMAYSAYDWFISDVMTWQETSISFVAGFALMQMKDKISDWIGQAASICLDWLKSKVK